VSKVSAPLGSNLARSYRALIERLSVTRIKWHFAKAAKDIWLPFDDKRPWMQGDLARIGKGAPVIWFECGTTGTGPFEHISDGVVETNPDGGFYATVQLPRSAVHIIGEKEFFALFMRPWSLWRRTHWNWLRHWL
jgi:hypothetical protein